MQLYLAFGVSEEGSVDVKYWLFKRFLKNLIVYLSYIEFDPFNVVPITPKLAFYLELVFKYPMLM